MNINMELLMQYISFGLATIGVLAFVVSVVTQTIKELVFFKKIPTNIVAMVTSFVIGLIVVVGVCQHFNVVITWYYVFASLIAAFIVYLVSTGGWERLSEIWSRSKYNKK